MSGHANRLAAARDDAPAVADAFSSVSVATATLAAQLRGCTSSVPLIVESTSSRCECP